MWVKDLNSRIDFVNGFTESYGDPLGMKASWESLVNFKDLEATRPTELISGNAQWFENQASENQHGSGRRNRESKVEGAVRAGGRKMLPNGIVWNPCSASFCPYGP